MPDQITLEEALSLVSFKYYDDLGWQVLNVPSRVHGDVLEVKGNVFNGIGGSVGKVCGDVLGSIGGNIYGDVEGDVEGAIHGDVDGFVGGNVKEYVEGTINGRKWEFVETPKDKLQRLIDGAGEEELLKLINQLENR